MQIRIEHSPSLASAVERFLDELRGWTGRVLAAYPEGFASDSHDGGTFMLPWEVYVEATGDRRPVGFMKRYRDDAKQHFEETGQWLDGYWRRQEVHHGTEHFDLFLRALWQLERGDYETVRQMEDAAEHIGNWKAGFPDWYDWQTGLFRSMHLGTEDVGEATCNVPDHMRMVRLCLLAHDMTGAERYLQLAVQHAGKWADAVLSDSNLPVALMDCGSSSELGAAEETYRSFVGAAPDSLDSNLERAEVLLASAVPDAFLEVWQKTDDSAFLEAAEKILDAGAEVLQSPIAWQVHGAIRRYRCLTASRRYDSAVANLEPDATRQIHELRITPEPETRCVTGPMGMRGDKPDWVDQDNRPAPSPLLCALKALVTGDDKLLASAVDLGRAHFQLGYRTFGDVTHHGCGSRSLVAVCYGHGRLNRSGVVSEVLAPALSAAQTDKSGDA